MPYIKKAGRRETEEQGPFEAGDLAYLLWLDILHWLDHGKPHVDNVRVPGPPSHEQKWAGWDYTNMSHVVGVLETVKAEFIRRHLVPYEDNKIAENGDVLGPETKRYGHDDSP